MPSSRLLRGIGGFPLSWRPGETISNVLADQLNCNLVIRPPWNDDICKLLGWHTELLKGRLHIVDVLVKNLIEVSAKLINILEDPLGKPTVRVRVDEQLHVEHASDLWTVKGENPFEENNIHLLRINRCEAIGHPAVRLVVIHWNLCWSTPDDVSEASLHEGIVKGIRVIPVIKSLAGSNPVSALELPVEGIL